MSLSEKIDHIPPHPYTLYICIQNTHSGKGDVGREQTTEKVRGAIVHKSGGKYQRTVFPVCKLDLTPVKTTFRVWFLYS
jgi:hypothetical protein